MKYIEIKKSVLGWEWLIEGEWGDVILSAPFKTEESALEACKQFVKDLHEDLET